jgi:aryl-alcohol dehydrogenase-like predicted oxidoreductase
VRSRRPKHARNQALSTSRRAIATVGTSAAGRYPAKFAIAHPNVTSALIGPRTAEHLEDLLAGLEVRLTDELLDRIDEIVPPGTDVGTLDQAFVPAALQHAALRRRPLPERAAV